MVYMGYNSELPYAKIFTTYKLVKYIKIRDFHLNDLSLHVFRGRKLFEINYKYVMVGYESILSDNSLSLQKRTSKCSRMVEISLLKRHFNIKVLLLIVIVSP